MKKLLVLLTMSLIPVFTNAWAGLDEESAVRAGREFGEFGTHQDSAAAVALNALTQRRAVALEVANPNGEGRNNQASAKGINAHSRQTSDEAAKDVGVWLSRKWNVFTEGLGYGYILPNAIDSTYQDPFPGFLRSIGIIVTAAVSTPVALLAGLGFLLYDGIVGIDSIKK